MSVSQPQSSTYMNDIDHAKLHRVIATDQAAADQTIAVQGDSKTRIGDADGVDYTEIESNGTMRAVGGAQVWRDSMVPATFFRSGVSALTFDLLTTNIYAYRFDINDEIHFSVQFNHEMSVGSVIYPHLHLVNKNAIGNTNYNVAVDFRYTWANVNSIFGAEQSELDKKTSFQNFSALTHNKLGLSPITPNASQGNISSILLGVIKRVAASVQPYNTNDIFILGLDIHHKCDTIGSRQEYIK